MQVLATPSSAVHNTNYYMPPPLTVHFPMMRSVKYQPIFHTLNFTLHCARVLMVEMVEILDERVGKHSVERVRLCNKQYITLGHSEI